MTDLRKQEIISILENSEVAVRNVVEGASEVLFLHKLEETSWSMAELVEHIIMVEKGILKTIQKNGAKASAEPVTSKLDEETITSLISNRSRKVKAPDQFVPKGIFTNRATALNAFEAHRESIKEFIRTTKLPLKNIGFPHFVAGMLNGESWFIFMAGHCLRHVAQMSEISNTAL